MGNCCSSPGGGGGDGDNLRRKRRERTENWAATGVIALRKAGVSELPADVALVPSPRVLDATDNRLERLPPGLQPSLQRLVSMLCRA